MAGAITLCELNNKTRIEWKINHFFTRSDNLIISPDFRLFKSKWFLQIHLGTPFVLPFSRTYDVSLEPLRMSLLTPYSTAEHHIEYRMGIQRSDGTEIKTEKFESVLKPGFGQTPQRFELISRKDFQRSINTLVSEEILTVFCSVRLLGVVEPDGCIPSPIQSIENDISFPIIIFKKEKEMAGEIILDDSKNEVCIDWKINDFFSRENYIIQSPDFVLFNVKWYLCIYKSSAKDLSMRLMRYASEAELFIEYRMGIQTTNDFKIITEKLEYPLQSDLAKLISKNDLESSRDTLAHGNSLKVFCTMRLLSDKNSANDVCVLGCLAFTIPSPCHKNNAKEITLCKSNNDTRIEWRISNFFYRQNHSPGSPCFMLFGANWHLKINTANKICKTVSLYMSLEICNFSMTERYIEYRMGIQKPDGSEIITNKFESVFQRRFLKRSSKFVLISGTDLKSLRDILAHENDLKVFCNVRLLSDEKMAGNVSPLITSTYDTKDPSGSPKGACLCKEHQTLIENFESLYRSKRLADITVRVKNTEFQAHKAILSTRSEVFASMFQHDTSEIRSGVVDITDCNPDSFEDFLLYLYTGKLDTVSSSNTVSLFKTADKYGVEELKDECVRCMIREMTVDSFCDVFHLAVKHGESNLLSTTTEFFIKNASDILITKEWLTLLQEHTSLCNELLVKFAKSGQQK